MRHFSVENATSGRHVMWLLRPRRANRGPARVLLADLARPLISRNNYRYCGTQRIIPMM
jgi:hypothetical protein